MILKIPMLGPLTVQVGGQPAAFRTDAERALLGLAELGAGQAGVIAGG